ncbi:hypothetical protein SAMN04515666_102155 [Bosea lupini]|uniref:Amidohydrolase family protein n=1 Tax=Bosea lupini TaxID=1036779 RepID=A0A1H7KCM2_9HYPH|nr:hypothetical protein SAMN04515666_102155 [Bosea lupini]
MAGSCLRVWLSSPVETGVIASGKRADLILVAPELQPGVVATIGGGRLVHLADQRLLV